MNVLTLCDFCSIRKQKSYSERWLLPISSFGFFDLYLEFNWHLLCLVKGSQGFGFAIEERRSSDNGVGIFVRSLATEGSAAEVCWRSLILDFAISDESLFSSLELYLLTEILSSLDFVINDMFLHCCHFHKGRHNVSRRSAPNGQW